jgi:hypothetical protein
MQPFDPPTPPTSHQSIAQLPREKILATFFLMSFLTAAAKKVGRVGGAAFPGSLANFAHRKSATADSAITPEHSVVASDRQNAANCD